MNYFKAKKLDNGLLWVYGYYVKLTKDNGEEIHLIFTGKSDSIYPLEKFEIDPKTLCRNTFAFDINGKEIWENDIVKYEWGENNYYYGKIEYDIDYGFCFYNKFRHEQLQIEFKEVEVVGNVFDNPEIKLNE